MRHVPNEKSNPFVDFAKAISDVGYNKDVILTKGTVVEEFPLTIRIDGSGLLSTELTPLEHLTARSENVRFRYGSEDLNGTIFYENRLNEGDRVSIIYDDESPKKIGVVLGVIDE